jgi:16S rRNA (guanine527-N7)-methyltransferase
MPHTLASNGFALTNSNELRDALDRHGIDVPATCVDTMNRYCRLVWKLNESINLTRHTTYDLFVTRDVLDACQLAKLLEADEEILDVGTGAGVPGLLIAMLRSDVQVSVCESVGKKAAVVDSIIGELNLPVPVYAERAERVLDDFRFSSITARAVGPTWKILKWFQPHWQSIGRLLLIKGPQWVEERGEARHRGLLADLELRRVTSYPTPGRDADSVILSIRPRCR